MAQPSSTHREHRSEREDRHRDRSDRERERERDRDRERRSSRSHHHHRTISSTTLLLVLSLVLAVLAVMLSLPSGQLPPALGGTPDADAEHPTTKGTWGILTPKRSQQLVQREGLVAQREAEVARREAELLAGAPGGVLPPQQPVSCPVCPTIVQPPPMAFEPVQTVIKEVVKETEALTPPGWYQEGQVRFQDILDRELKIADREREISRREEQVNRREHDAARREAWIMEQLIALGNEEPQAPIEEEYVYESTPRPPVVRRPKAQKFIPIEEEELPPLVYTETVQAVATEYRTVTETHTQSMQSKTLAGYAPANTRLAPIPTPQPVTMSWSTGIPKTTSVQFIHEEIVVHPPPIEEEVVEVEEVIEPAPAPVKVRAGRPPPPRAPQRWW